MKVADSVFFCMFSKGQRGLNEMEDTRREDTTRTVERTRREVARMEVEDGCREQQASKRIGRTVDKMVSMAKEGWSKIKGLLDGKRLVRDRDGSVTEGEDRGDRGD
jgi:hypothetical protein